MHQVFAHTVHQWFILWTGKQTNHISGTLHKQILQQVFDNISAVLAGSHTSAIAPQMV